MRAVPSTELEAMSMLSGDQAMQLAATVWRRKARQVPVRVFPDRCLAVAVGCRDQDAVRGPAYLINSAGRSLEDLIVIPLALVPDPERGILGGGSEALVVRRPGRAGDRLAMAHRGVEVASARPAVSALPPDSPADCRSERQCADAGGVPVQAVEEERHAQGPGSSAGHPRDMPVEAGQPDACLVVPRTSCRIAVRVCASSFALPGRSLESRPAGTAPALSTQRFQSFVPPGPPGRELFRRHADR